MLLSAVPQLSDIDRQHLATGPRRAALLTCASASLHDERAQAGRRLSGHVRAGGARRQSPTTDVCLHDAAVGTHRSDLDHQRSWWELTPITC